ncbi:penicillin-binding protein 1B [Photobacterium lipolyticum]|uniref:Penicillin-binding protein 1B n=1 Tax=Photobacterium lipolyticum TaxID=266810 RepID=A0A2T3MXG1_9GAMM|nr:penicillin-binding protein 1B [Photobacterium lipolyticum]PSW04652.1 penicillin-binding protein 1B [Photobacterium lipolyticum]
MIKLPLHLAVSGSKQAGPKTPVPKKPVTTRRKSPAKAPAKKGAAKTSRSKKKTTAKKRPQKPGWLKWLAGFCLKVTVAVIAVLVVIGIYLDMIVRDKFDGQLWNLPAVVYGRVLTLQPGQAITLEEVRRELDLLQYHKVRNPQRIGEYSSSSTRIELIRRPFEFDDGHEGQRHVMLTFDQGGLNSIHQAGSQKQLGYVRIEPKMLGMLASSSDEQRLFLPREQFPEILVDALLVTEDRDFYHHEGVSPLAIGRALFANLKAGRTVQGGSTLTQQLAKNLFLTRERSLWRKLREAGIALIIDYRYSKDRVLEAYLNEIYLGQDGAKEVHGFALGARLYFGRPIQELRIDQQALLVGLIKGPSYYNPWRNPERARQRRDLVLRLMMDNGTLNGTQYEQAASRPLDLQAKPMIATRQPAYFQQLQRELKQKVGDKFTPGVGLRIFSTLDPLSQQEAEKTVAEMIPQLNKKAGTKVETALVAVDRLSGEVRAMIGGSQPGYAGFNRALDASRQIGSLVKPAVYLAALRQPERFSLASTIDDKPIMLQGSKGTQWKPRNYDRKFRGEVPLYYALAKSLNVPTVNIGLQVGLGPVIETMAQLGVDRNEIPRLPSILLGAFTLTPFEVTQMFQTITSGGRKAQLTALRAVVDQQGNILYQGYPKAAQAVPEQAAWLTTYGMKNVVSQGTARFLQPQFGWAALAGKTGTTDKARDSWYAGADGREVVTVWVGRDDNKPVNLTGSAGALRLYSHYLQRRSPEVLRLAWPKKMTTVKYNRQPNGTLEMDCAGQQSLPVWDQQAKLKERCRGDKPAAWIKEMFSW